MAFALMLMVSACSSAENAAPASSSDAEIPIPSLPAFTAQLAKIIGPLAVNEVEHLVSCPLGDPEAVFGHFLDLVTADAISTADLRRSDNGSHVACDISVPGDSRVELNADIGIADPSDLAKDLAGFSSTTDENFGGTFYSRCWKVRGLNNCQAVWVKGGLLASLGIYGTAELTEPLPTLTDELVGMFDKLMTLDPAAMTVDTTP